MLNRAFFGQHLGEDEELVRVVHKHWLVGLKVLFWPSLVAAVCIGGMYLTVASRGVFLGLSIATCISLIWWLRNFFDYFLDAWIVTNEGVIDVAWHGWFHRESARILYSDINGVSYEIHGVLPTLLRYGTISIEKISNGASISLDYVKRPKKVEADILRLMEAYLHHKNLKDSKQVHELLAAMVAEQINHQQFVADADE